MKRAREKRNARGLANEIDEACRYNRYNYEEKYTEREREGERLAENIEALALSNDRAHLRAGNGPTATRSALDSQWRGVCRSVKTLVVAGIYAYKSYSPAKILTQRVIVLRQGQSRSTSALDRRFVADLSTLPLFLPFLTMLAPAWCSAWTGTSSLISPRENVPETE